MDLWPEVWKEVRSMQGELIRGLREEGGGRSRPTSWWASSGDWW